jgi:hypothetical protein
VNGGYVAIFDVARYIESMFSQATQSIVSPFAILGAALLGLLLSSLLALPAQK